MNNKTKFKMLAQFFLSYIVPKKNNLILLGSCSGNKFMGNTKYLYLYLTKNKNNFDFTWVTQSEEVIKKLNARGLPVIHKDQAFWKILRAKYLLIDVHPEDISYSSYKLGRFNYVNLFHGSFIKQLGKYAIKSNNLLSKHLTLHTFKDYTFLCRSSKEKEHLSDEYNNDKITVTGYPRNEVFTNNDIKFDDFEKKYNLKQFNRVILYAPTWRDNMVNVKPFSDKFMKKLKYYIEKNNYVLLVRKHAAAIDLNVPTSTNVIDISNEDDVQEFLPLVDVLITDYSSVWIDYSLLFKPVIFYAYDLGEYITDCRSMHSNYYDEVPPSVARTEDELFNYLTDLSWFDDLYYKQVYTDLVIENCPYATGRCQRILNWLENENKK